MSDAVMVDSSAWVEYFRQGRGAVSEAVDELPGEDGVLLCGMVEMEIVQGLRSRERVRILELFAALPYLDTGREDYIAAGERSGELRRQGITIPSADCLIGVLCLRHGVPLLTLDHHFDHLPDLIRYPVGAP